MSKPIIFTADDLKAYIQGRMSERRYVHSLGVADTTEAVLSHFGCRDYTKHWNDIDAAHFCGLAHDIAREMTDEEILKNCTEKGIVLSSEDIKAPVLAHGIVSAEMAMDLAGGFPMSWYKALCVHTSGNAGMDELALALFIADYIEPSRKFMTDEKRAFYLGSSDIGQCAYRILCDMIGHWKDKGFFEASKGSVAMKSWLERVYGSTYE